MESSLLFFFVGLSIFGAKHFVEKRSEALRFIVFAGSGVLSAGIIALIAGSALFPVLRVPAGFWAVVGGMAGIILYAAERSGLIDKPGIRYITTVLLGSILAGVAYGLMILYRTTTQIDSIIPKNLLFLSFVLMGFLTVFGYTFPKRWLKKRNEELRTE
jgi:hypothetical protein